MAATNQVEDTNTYGEGFLGGFLITTSGSYQTLMATVKVVPQEETYHYGSDYLSSLVVALPVPFDLARAARRGHPERSRRANGSSPTWRPDARRGPGTCRSRRRTCNSARSASSSLYVLMGWGLTRLWRFVSIEGMGCSNGGLQPDRHVGDVDLGEELLGAGRASV